MTTEDFTPTTYGEVRSLARLMNVSEEELIERAHDLQPMLTDLEQMTNSTYFYLMGMLLGRKSKVVGG